MKKKIKLLTHNDLDGVGCYIVAKILLAHQHHYGVDVCGIYGLYYYEIKNQITRMPSPKPCWRGHLL